MTIHAILLSKSRVYLKTPKKLLNPVCCVVFVIVSNLTHFQQCVKWSFVNGRTNQTEEDWNSSFYLLNRYINV